MDGPGGIYTVGYGNRSVEDLLRVLQRHGVTHLVDVRSKPYSKFNPDYTKDRLAKLVRHAGLNASYLGDVLGGATEDPAAPAFQNGLRRLAALAQDERVAAMCAELRPEGCHRVRLIGATLQAHGVPVRHIDEAGALLTQEQAVARGNGGNRQLDVGL